MLKNTNPQPNTLLQNMAAAMQRNGAPPDVIDAWRRHTALSTHHSKLAADLYFAYVPPPTANEVLEALKRIALPANATVIAGMLPWHSWGAVKTLLDRLVKDRTLTATKVVRSTMYSIASPREKRAGRPA